MIRKYTLAAAIAATLASPALAGDGVAYFVREGMPSAEALATYMNPAPAVDEVMAVESDAMREESLSEEAAPTR